MMPSRGACRRAASATAPAVPHPTPRACNPTARPYLQLAAATQQYDPDRAALAAESSALADDERRLSEAEEAAAAAAVAAAAARAKAEGEAAVAREQVSGRVQRLQAGRSCLAR